MDVIKAKPVPAPLAQELVSLARLSWAKHLDLDELNVFGPNGYIGQYVKGKGYKTIAWGDNPH